jgi:hypothetical protein
VLRIGEARAQPYRAGALDNLIVDQVKLAFIKLGLVILAIGENRQRSFRHVLLDFQKVGLWKRKDQRDRLDLRHVDQTVGISRVDNVAFIDLTNPGNALDGSGKPRLAQVFSLLLDTASSDFTID